MSTWLFLIFQFTPLYRRNHKVYEFDYFYQDFKNIIKDILDNSNGNDEILLNISSGTPAMKSGLAVLQTLGEYPCKLIQVTTPVKKMNEHNHKDYDVELLWEYNEDNEDGFENRCREISCPTLSNIKQEEIIKKHIRAYDYSAALDVAESLPEDVTKDYYDLLLAAYYRELLQINEVNKIMKKFDFEIFPIKSEKECECVEYALNLGVKLKRGEYADYIRGISPLLVDLFEIALQNTVEIDIDQYCCIRKRKGRKIREWDMRKLEGTEVLRALQQKYGFHFDGGFIRSDHILALIQYFGKDDKLIQLTEDLRNVEEKLRNKTAHTIVSVTEKTIYSYTGFHGNQIQNMLEKMFKYTGIKIPKGTWSSYESMNDKIIFQMTK